MTETRRLLLSLALAALASPADAAGPAGRSVRPVGRRLAPHVNLIDVKLPEPLALSAWPQAPHGAAFDPLTFEWALDQETPRLIPAPGAARTSSPGVLAAARTLVRS